MKKLQFVICFLALMSASPATSQEKYQYIVDLTVVEDDRVMVELITPAISENTITFYLPKIIPGTYKEADYGRFVSNLKAYDKKGGELSVNRTDENTWKIEKAKKLTRITYWVDDSYDFDMGDNQVYPMAGTNIEAGVNFVINTSGFFGYLEGMKENDVDLKIIYPENFYGSTGLIGSTRENMETVLPADRVSSIQKGAKVDVFEISDYNRLIDSPLMYCIPDTTIIDVGGTEVLISVFSPGKQVQSEYVAENIKEILMAQKEYLGGTLPVDKYAFIFYFEELTKVAPVQGALEHSYSSFYYLPDVPQENLKQTLRDVAAHEFFHIVTPLNIHSEEIQYFDFNQPQMSEHLWLYEGVTEYFAGHVQAKYGIVTLEEYLEMLKQKMVTATNNFNDTLPFTDLSKYTIDKYPDQYSNVYQKGALIGMVLDIKLRELSGGTYGLQTLLADLSKNYGIDKPFKDPELFDIIEGLTYPEIREFFNRYVAGPTPLPYAETFKKVGITYIPFENYTDFTLGNFGVGFNPEISRVFVNDASNLNEFGKDMGYQTGDVIIKVQSQDVPLSPPQIGPFIQQIQTAMKEGENFTMTVLRKDENDQEQEVKLEATTIKVEKQRIHEISIDGNASEAQLKLREAWLKP